MSDLVDLKACPEPVWKDEPDHHDFRAAWSYLSQHFPPDKACDMHSALINGKMTSRPAKDIIRAASLIPLPINDPKVQHNLNKIQAGKKLSPCLMVVRDGKTFIADGYHRVSAVYNLNYDEQIPCVIVWERHNGLYILCGAKYDPANKH